MDRFEAMAVLIEVIDRGSLSAAGRSLRIPLATVSRKITDLETLLGAKLLVRGTRSLALTGAGATYIIAARRLLEDLRTAEREAAGEMVAPRGELVVTAPVMFGRLHLLPVVTEFLEAYPEIDVRLPLGDRNLQLVDDQIDMAVRIGALPDGSAIATRVGAMRTVVCASPRFLDQHGRPDEPGRIAGLPCIRNDTPINAGGWAFSVAESPTLTTVPGRPRLSVSTAEAAMEAARRDVGLVRLLHYQVADAVRDGSLEIVLQAFEPQAVPVHVLHVARERMPLKMRVFLDFAVPRLRRQLKRLEALDR